MPVHLYGQMACVERLEGLGPMLIEDAAQSHGATRNSRTSGSVGLAAGTSFYPGKNLGAYGDAGAVLTNDDDVAARVRALRNCGGVEKYRHPERGFNSRLDTIQAVVLSAKLRRLADWNRLRQEAAVRYEELLDDLGEVTRPSVLEGNVHVWHLYVVRVARRDDVLSTLRSSEIGAGVHYPVPIHLQGAFSALGHKAGDFPRAEEAAASVLSLPMFPGITADQQERVVDVLRKAVR
jgi:dTDP-4-amino-4,6-dideoxygalactose transaminase